MGLDSVEKRKILLLPGVEVELYSGPRYQMEVYEYDQLPLHIVQTAYVAHPASYPVYREPGQEADHSHQSSAEVKNGGIILQPHTPWRGA
jgi:hypothetical protein